MNLIQPQSSPVFTSFETNRRILIVDDNDAIHEDFLKILSVDPAEADFEAEEAATLGNLYARKKPRIRFEMDFASQGEVALQRVQAAAMAGRRYAVVFMDVRMPPGWNGLETTQKLWEADADLQVVLCTAFSDHSWEEMMEMISAPERVLILKKPFDAIEVLQLAHALTEKWSFLQAARLNTAALEQILDVRTRELQRSNQVLTSEIQERKLAEEARQNSEAGLALAQQVARLGSWEIDLVDCQYSNSNPTRWSDEAFRIFGFKRNDTQASPTNFFKTVHAHDREKIEQAIVDLLRTGTPSSLDHRIVWPNGEQRVVHQNAKLIFDENSKKPLKIVGTVQDITERKANEEKFRAQAELLNLAHDAIIVRGLDNRITFWNPGAEQLYGWSADEVMGKSVKELLHQGGTAAFDLATSQLMAAGKWSGELRKMHRTGRALTVEGRWTLLRDEDGNPKAILAINTDISEKKKLEAQFLRAQRMESIGTLAGGVAHDLNNALAPIMMGVELVKMQYPDQSEIIDIFQTSAKRGADMVRQLLTFAKGAEGERVSVQTSHLVKEMYRLIKGSFPKNIEVLTNCDLKLPTVLGDATQIHQILLNLCVNARDAMPNGGTLTLEARSAEVDAAHACAEKAKPGPYVILKVRDTGTGIAPEILEHIFDPFFTTKSLDQGTGLGLSTVIGIVRGHGGFLQVHSKVGEGSTFTVYLPAESVGKESGIGTSKGLAFCGRGETILWVDDEPALRELGRIVLRKLNLKTLTASNGADGLMQAAEHRTELSAIVTDLNMPHMDGLAFVRELRRILPDIPIAVASGRMDEAMAEKFKALGVTSRLDKPYTEIRLTDMLQNLLGRKSS